MGIVGLPKETVKIEDPLPDLVFKSLEIHTVHGRKIFHTWKECEKLISSGQEMVRK
jgi:threonine 3-dehydrogenase